MSKKLVISFPGGRTGEETPLLYFSAKCFENRGYDKIFITHPKGEDKSFDAIYHHAKERLLVIDFSEYEEVVFVAKSLGTIVACRLKEELQISAAFVLLTPLEETLCYMNKDNSVLYAAIGTEDKYLDCQVLAEHCKREGIPCHIEEGVGHWMELLDDVNRDIEILGNVVGGLKEVLEIQ